MKAAVAAAKTEHPTEVSLVFQDRVNNHFALKSFFTEIIQKRVKSTSQSQLYSSDYAMYYAGSQKTGHCK